jgi:hypothetical protein
MRPIGDKNGMNMLEKRRYQRLAVKLPVTLRYRGRLIPATMLNLSCGGACIQTSEANLDFETPVEIVFDLDEKQRDISMRGNIVHQGEEKAGVRFSNLFSDGHKAVQEYLRKNLN